MAKLQLSDEEKQQIIEALNNDVEPSPDLIPKLFPGTAEKFDVVALDRAKIPTLEYAGKRSKAAILAEASSGIGAAPLQVVRSFGKVKDDKWQNMIVQGDNLQFLKTCYRNEDPLIKDKVKGKVKLIYIDPPFATKSDFGGKEGEKSYTDKVVTAEFVEAVRERLIYLKELLHPEGGIYIHLDQKMSHYVKVELDALFGKEKYVNEIVWSYRTGGASKTAWSQKHDTILFYSKSSTYTFNLQKEKAYTKSKSRKAGIVDYGGGTAEFFEDENGVYNWVNARDVWEISYINSQSDERLGYPTQKPEELLKRIILASSDKNDLILDVFAGSGTTPAVAEKLGRCWIACDFGKHAIYTMQRRMLHISESKALEDEKNEAGEIVVKKGDPYNKETKPFSIVSSGAYDFTHVMDLRKHKDAYINFVLGLFQQSRDDERAKRYKLSNIYAEKDKSPIEVYPVWDDEFLKEIKIDEDYLKDIITQSSGRLQGDYYIIAPETCTNIGDTTLKTDAGKEVIFKILSFPYKVLEDISRKLTLQDQPSKQEDVNQLISSTAFYFNEDVGIDLERTEGGLKITNFETKILDKDGNHFTGFDGLAMLLVDDEYEADKPFDMDKTVFLKDIKEGGEASIPGLGKSVAVIAIDKHGNESKPIRIK